MRNEETENGEQWDLSRHHPDHEWLKRFNRWELTVNLTYPKKQSWKKGMKTHIREVNQFFGELSYELTGRPRPEELSWFVCWQVEKDHLHIHGVLGSNDKVNILKGRENSFTGYPALISFLGRKWIHGQSFYEIIHDQDGWINYITRPGTVVGTWSSPAMQSLKSQGLERRVNEILAR